MDATTNATPCPGCGQPAAGGPYCAACGQRQPAAGDFGLRRMASEAWEEASSLDSRLWRSVSGLLRPGQLTADWLAYRWRQVHPPLRLYLVCSGIYFFLAWGVYFEAGAQWLALHAEGMPPAVRAVYADPSRAEHDRVLRAHAADRGHVVEPDHEPVQQPVATCQHRGKRAGAGRVGAGVHGPTSDILVHTTAVI